MDFIGLKAVAAREIALAFGVPPMLLGLPGDATHSNYHEANRALWRQTVLPLAGKIVAAVTQGLARWYPGATLAVDLDRVTELASDREMLWKMVDAAGFLTLAEKREMVGLEDAGDVAGDTILGVPRSGSGADAGPGTPNRVSPGIAERKYNPNHDPATGEFSSGPGGGGALPNLAAGISAMTGARGVTGDRAGNASLTILPPLPKPYDPFAPPGATSDPFNENRRLAPVPVNSHGYYPARGDDTLLARAIYAESLSNPEDFEAIGWAVANRVGAKEHGRTLDAVLHKPNQYEFLEVGGGPKGDGKFWNETADPTKLTGANLSGWNRALAVASGILSGKTPDVTGGATYFISSDKYVRGRPVTATQGFFRTALTSGRLVDAPYLTTSARKTKNHFYIEMPPPPLPPKAGK